MSTVIKAKDRPATPHATAFNFDDLTQQANQYLAKVRVQAEQIVAQANQEAAGIRQQAEHAGRQAAQRAAEQLQDVKLARQLETLLPALREVTGGIQQARHDWLTHWERQAVHVAAAIAARVIRRELSQQPEITLTLVREALELAAGSAEVRIYLNPADHAALGGRIQKLIGELSRLAPAELVADPNMTPGGCRVETRHGVIDQQIESQLARIEEELA